MRPYPDLALTAAMLTAAVLVVAWATMPTRRRLGMSAGFGAFGTWIQWQTYQLRLEAAERQRRTETK